MATGLVNNKKDCFLLANNEYTDRRTKNKIDVKLKKGVLVVRHEELEDDSLIRRSL